MWALGKLQIGRQKTLGQHSCLGHVHSLSSTYSHPTAIYCVHAEI